MHLNANHIGQCQPKYSEKLFQKVEEATIMNIQAPDGHQSEAKIQEVSYVYRITT